MALAASTRGFAFTLLLGLALSACPVPAGSNDGNEVEFDAGNPAPKGACSGGCAANQMCDTVKRVCVEACGGCDAGTCVKVNDSYQCQPTVISCASGQCQVGQVACVGGACSCLAAANASGDTCRSTNRWCDRGQCQPPKRYEQCQWDDSSAPCPVGHVCDPVFRDADLCLRNCGVSGVVCDRGELCARVTANQYGCLPQGMFRDQECNQHLMNDDGGVYYTDAGSTVRITVPPGNTCLLKAANASITDQPGRGTGNCTYSLFKLWQQGVYPAPICRPPGAATLGQVCKKDYTAGTLATQCATGLECALTTKSDEGVCLRMCNANPPSNGVPSAPGCESDEACVNIYRYTDPSNNSVVGVCMKTCDVFNAAKRTCADVGAAKASCVPTVPSGEFIVSTDGEGVCIPQQVAVASTGAPCSGVDPFNGAACEGGELCATVDSSVTASCTTVCDVECSPTDGGVAPARCATETNARCASGKTCRRVSSNVAAHVGFCL